MSAVDRPQPRAPRAGDRILLPALIDAGIELVWARIEITEEDDTAVVGAHRGGSYPYRVGYAYEEIRRDGDVITRRNIVRLNPQWRDPADLIEGYELTGTPDQ